MAVVWAMQELAEGRSLAQLAQEGWRPDEAEIVRIAQQLLAILAYLSSRRPPVVHRSAPPAALRVYSSSSVHLG